MASLEEWLIDKLNNFSPAQGVLLDVGAYQGSFTKALLGSNRFASAILFEPNDVNMATLNSTLATDKRVNLVNSAVSDQAGQVNFNYSTDLATGSLLPYDMNNDATHTKGIQNKTVSQISLDDFIESAALKAPVTLLKIDTQGNDLRVLHGAKNLIQSQKPIVVVEMIYVSLYEKQGSPYEITNWLKEQGYVLGGIFNQHQTAEGWLAFSDAVFVPESFTAHFTTPYSAAADTDNLEAENKMLRDTCEERLALIQRLDFEMRARMEQEARKEQQPALKKHLKLHLKKLIGIK